MKRCIAVHIKNNKIQVLLESLYWGWTLFWIIQSARENKYVVAYGGKRAETVQYETQIHIYVCYLVIWADFFNGPNVQSTKSRTILLNIFSFVEWWFLYHKDHMIHIKLNL